jgi:phage baseplate assembly protein W
MSEAHEIRYLYFSNVPIVVWEEKIEVEQVKSLQTTDGCQVVAKAHMTLWQGKGELKIKFT